MIRVALKHWIYEICINKFFEGIYKNFDVCDITLQSYKVGQYIHHLQIKADETDYIYDLYKCKIVYKKGKKAVIECNDGAIPSLICIKDDAVSKLIAKHLAPDNYGDLFDE